MEKTILHTTVPLQKAALGLIRWPDSVARYIAMT